MTSETRSGEIWVEKYRPRKLSDIVGQSRIVPLLQAYVKKRTLPHLLFAGPPGTGKTTAALCLARDLFGEDWRSSFLELNSSDERGIDTVRGTIKNYARSAPLGDIPFKLLFLDEADNLCLERETEVTVLEEGARREVAVSELDRTVDLPSYNFEEQRFEPDRGEVFREGKRSIFRLVLESGEEVLCTKEHPFFRLDRDGMVRKTPLEQLDVGDRVVVSED